MPRSDYILCSLRPIPCDSERQRAFIILYIPTNQDTSFLTLTWKASTTILQKVLFLHVLSAVSPVKTGMLLISNAIIYPPTIKM